MSPLKPQCNYLKVFLSFSLTCCLITTCIFNGLTPQPRIDPSPCGPRNIYYPHRTQLNHPLFCDVISESQFPLHPCFCYSTYLIILELFLYRPPLNYKFLERETMSIFCIIFKESVNFDHLIFGFLIVYIYFL